jgi:putative ABC transport system permease protein
MLRNYCTVALRTFSRQKVFTFINISGLAIGLSGALLIFGYIIDELSYDIVHPYSKYTYRIGTEYLEDGNEEKYSVAPPLWSSQLKEQYPDVQSILRTLWFGSPTSVNYKDKDKILLTEELFFVESNYNEVLYFDVISEDKGNAFREINSIALNKSAAEKIFGSENPIGKILTIKHIWATSDKELNLMVTAIFKDYPSNTNFKPSYLVPMESLRSVIEWGNYDDMFTGWLQGWMVSYVVFKDGTNMEYIGNEFEKLVSENLGEESGNFIPFLKNINYLHFDNEVKWNNEGQGDIMHVYIFGSIGIFLILIASINYMNLATARSAKRSREVGLRKVMGSHRSQLIFQFIIESFLTTLLSLILSLIIVFLILPVFNTLAQKDFEFLTFFNIRLIVGIGVIIFIVALLAGSYPAFYLSKFRPVDVLKGGKLSIKGSDPLRKILVIFQFSISFLLLICSGVLMKQINLIKSTKLNEQGEQILSIRYGGGIAPIEKYPVYKNSVLQDPNFIDLTMANHLPRLHYFGWIGITIKIPEVSDQDYQWSELNVDFNFPKVFNLEFLIGRDFIVENPADSNACLINEAAIKNLGIDITEAVGLRIEDSESQRISTVIGVVKDFPYRSMHQTIEPLRIITRLHWLDQIVYVKLPVKNMQEHIQTLESKWKELFPGIGFDYWFLDDEFNRMYESEIRMSHLSESFSFIAIFIACLGLFGLASYMTEQRTREIGIRKVFGASVKQILVLFLSTFIKMLIISAIIAGPIAYYLMNKWLQQFVYQISIDWKIILSAIGIVFVITILTVSFELIKASTANPVNAIRHE